MWRRRGVLEGSLQYKLVKALTTRTARTSLTMPSWGTRSTWEMCACRSFAAPNRRAHSAPQLGSSCAVPCYSRDQRRRLARAGRLCLAFYPDGTNCKYPLRDGAIGKRTWSSCVFPHSLSSLSEAFFTLAITAGGWRARKADGLYKDHARPGPAALARPSWRR
jgi:hypothetical protein